MSILFRIRRGLRANLPTLSEGEPGYTTDEKRLYIGTSGGNVQLAKQTDVDTALTGKANTIHNQAASTITAGTLAGQVLANATAQATLTTAQVRNIYAGTAELTPGTSALATGAIYVMYE